MLQQQATPIPMAFEHSDWTKQLKNIAEIPQKFRLLKMPKALFNTRNTDAKLETSFKNFLWKYSLLMGLFLVAHNVLAASLLLQRVQYNYWPCTYNCPSHFSTLPYKLYTKFKSCSIGNSSSRQQRQGLYLTHHVGPNMAIAAMFCNKVFVVIYQLCQ